MKTNRFTESFDKAEEAFSAKYAAELKQLKGLSKEDINKILPIATGMHTYQELIEIIEKASQDNLSQAQLISEIQGLGALAIKIAKTIPSLAKLL